MRLVDLRRDVARRQIRGPLVAARADHEVQVVILGEHKGVLIAHAPVQVEDGRAAHLRLRVAEGVGIPELERLVPATDLRARGAVAHRQRLLHVQVVVGGEEHRNRQRREQCVRLLRVPEVGIRHPFKQLADEALGRRRHLDRRRVLGQPHEVAGVEGVLEGLGQLVGQCAGAWQRRVADPSAQERRQLVVLQGLDQQIPRKFIGARVGRRHDGVQRHRSTPRRMQVRPRCRPAPAAVATAGPLIAAVTFTPPVMPLPGAAAITSWRPGRHRQPHRRRTGPSSMPAGRAR